MKLLRLFVLLFIATLALAADTVYVTAQTNELPILDHSELLVTENNFSPADIQKQHFTPMKKPYLNLGITDKSVWVRFRLENNTSQPLPKLLVINNPMLIHINLYKKQKETLVSVAQKRETLNPFYSLHLAPHNAHTYYLHIKSLSTLKFGLALYKPDFYKKQDQKKQLINIFLIGIVLTMMIYNFLLFFFIKEPGYFYYSIYLFLIVLLEISYIGFSPIYLPQEWVVPDNHFILEKVVILVFFYGMYTISFLKLRQFPRLYHIILFLLTLALLDLFCFCLNYSHQLIIALAIAAIFLIFIFATAIYSYFHGVYEARFFILGFSVVLATYIILILDAFAVISLVYHMQNILIVAIAVEAILLSIAFVDKYKLLQEAKLQKEHQLLEESQTRAQYIQNEVNKKTDQLQHAMHMQDLLFNELHHRVKNNLQLILSITRMQQAKLTDTSCKEHFTALAARINAIATTHNTIYLSQELEIISMKEYITQLTQGLKAGDIENKIKFDYNITLNLPLKEAISVGLIINELVSNALKYAFLNQEGLIAIIMKEDYIEVHDNGIGFDINKRNNSSLGMQLVEILVKDQLKGTIEIHTDSGTQIIIRFAHA